LQKVFASSPSILLNPHKFEESKLETLLNRSESRNTFKLTATSRRGKRSRASNLVPALQSPPPRLSQHFKNETAAGSPGAGSSHNRRIRRRARPTSSPLHHPQQPEQKQRHSPSPSASVSAAPTHPPPHPPPTQRRRG
jgi:hypothetical protein